MGTRGYIGWQIDGKKTLSYNHYDSYPSSLGVQVLRDITAAPGLATLRLALSTIRCVDQDEVATPEDVKDYGHLHQNVSTGVDNYALFRDLQGQLAQSIGAGVICTMDYEPDDAEYSYIINFDDCSFTATATDSKKSVSWHLDKLPSEEDFLAGCKVLG